MTFGVADEHEPESHGRRASCGSQSQKCQGQDSNLHALRHQILSLARLPISPPWLLSSG